MVETGDPWGDEGFGGEDDWEGGESVELDLEDEEGDELDPSALELDDEDLDDEGLGSDGELGESF
jgi:hypothetical protein